MSPRSQVTEMRLQFQAELTAVKSQSQAELTKAVAGAQERASLEAATLATKTAKALEDTQAALESSHNERLERSAADHAGERSVLPAPCHLPEGMKGHLHAAYPSASQLLPM